MIRKLLSFNRSIHTFFLFVLSFIELLLINFIYLRCTQCDTIDRIAQKKKKRFDSLLSDGDGALICKIMKFIIIFLFLVFFFRFYIFIFYIFAIFSDIANQIFFRSSSSSSSFSIHIFGNLSVICRLAQ